MEGYSISATSASVATESSAAVETEPLWILPVAVAVTWTVTYVATNIALSYVADLTNENLPYFNS